MRTFKNDKTTRPVGVQGEWTPSFWLTDIADDNVFECAQTPAQKHYDLVIVGAGITGLTAALFVKQHQPKLSVLLIERGLYSAGATTQSAGFATIGSISEILMHEQRESTDAIVELTHRKLIGLRLLEQICGKDDVDFSITGDIDVFSDNEQHLFEQSADHLDRLNKVLFEVTGEQEIFAIADDDIDHYGLNAKHLIRNRLNGAFHPGKLSRALLNKAADQGVDIALGWNVDEIEPNRITATNNSGDVVAVNGNQILIATNAFASELSSELEDIRPGRGQVLVTTSIKNLKLKEPCHIRQGYDYARPVIDRNGNERVLLGGGRDLDFAAETTLEAGITEKVMDHLKETLQAVLLPKLQLGHDYQIDQTWSGFMGFGPTTAPRIKKLKDNIYCAVGLSSMGLAIGSLAGQEAADMLIADS